MKKVAAILVIIILGVLGYYAFSVGWIIMRVFIGLSFIFIFALGVIVGGITKR